MKVFIHKVAKELSFFPEVKFSRQDESLEIPKLNKEGFDVSIAGEGDGYILRLGLFHWHLATYEADKHLGLLLDALTPKYRIEELSKHNKPYKWTLQFQLRDGTWKNYATTSLFTFNFWSKPTKAYYQNQILSRQLLWNFERQAIKDQDEVEEIV